MSRETGLVVGALAAAAAGIGYMVTRDQGGGPPRPHPDAPPPPTGLAASTVTATTCDLTWAADPTASDVLDYQVMLAGKPLGAAVPTASAHLSGLVAKTTYVFTVSARNAAGSSAPSAAVTVTTPAPSLSGLIAVPPAKTQVVPTPPGDAANIVHYGADATGVADSRLAILAAIAAAQTSVASRTVYVPPGAFRAAKPAQGHIDWISVGPSGPAVRVLGAGRDVSRIIGENPVGSVLMALHIDGSTVEHVTLDTALHNGGPALTIGNANACHWQSIGACVGQAFGLRFLGKETAYVHGNSADDVYLNGGNQPQGGSTGWTADWDIDYQDGFTITNVEHVGGYIAVYYDGSSTAAAASLFDGYDYTPSDRADPSEWHGLYYTRCRNITSRRLALHGDQRYANLGIMLSHVGPANVVGDSNSALSFDDVSIPSGGFIIGDVVGLAVSSSQLDRIVVEPRFQAQGSFSATSHGTVEHHPQPGATISLSGL